MQAASLLKFALIGTVSLFGIAACKFADNSSQPSTETTLTEWTYIDGSGGDAGSLSVANGLNKDPVGRDARDIQLTSLGSKIYAIWTEQVVGSGVDYQIRVASFNGSVNNPNWTFVDGGGSVGISKDPTKPFARAPRIITFDNKVYASWQESYGGSNQGQIRVAVYNGNDSSPSWSFVDGDAVTGLNIDTNKTANNPFLVVFNSKLYLAWSEFYAAGPVYQIHVKVYNGNDSSPSWALASGANGISYSPTTTSALSVSLGAHNNKLYAAWSEGSVMQLRSAVYNGNDSSPSWTLVDGGAATGLNVSTVYSARVPSIVSHDDKLYMCWFEDNISNTHPIHVRVYNDNDSSPLWTRVDTGTAQGIKISASTQAFNCKLSSINNHLFAVFTEQETDGTLSRVRVLRYNNNDSSPSWSTFEGTSSIGINRDSTYNAENPAIVGHQGRPFAFWGEEDTAGVVQARGAAGPDL